MLAMLLVHHRIKLISVLVDGELYIVPEQRYHARTSFRFVASSVKTAKRITSLMDRFISLSLSLSLFDVRTRPHKDVPEPLQLLICD